MKEKYLINARIIDPKNQIDEYGGLIINEKGKIKAIGKKVSNENLPKNIEKIDLNKKILIPGLVDMRVFVGEPGYEYKENFRTLSNAALSGGVTSVVSMPNTLPVIDNVSMVDFLKRRGRDKSRINIFPAASLTKNIEGKQMTEFGLLKRKGIAAFTDGIKTVQNPQLMARIMNFASQSDSLIMQHAEDNILSEKGLINDGEETDHKSQHANMFALTFGLIPDKNIESVVNYVKEKNMSCSVYGSQILLEGLFDYGGDQHGIDLMAAKTERSWYNMIRYGSTITMEAWDKRYKPNLDLNHAWGGAPANIIVRKIIKYNEI